MKPRVLCAECQNEIQWGVRVCTHCGKPVEWPGEAASDGREVVSGGAVCPTCGSENAADAGFCGSCGAKLKVQEAGPSGKQQPSQGRPALKQGKARAEKKNRESSNPMFSWKVIFGFLGVLLILIVALEFFPSRDQQTAQPTSTAPPAPAANMQLTNQISDLEKRVAADPNDTQSILTLANVCQDGRFFDKAIVQYRKYLEKNPKDANARVDMGICYFETSNLDEARKEMELALKYDAKHVAAHFNLGIVSLRAGKVKEANEWFKKTIALAPKSDMGQQAKQILDQHSSPVVQNK
ncbi:MAG: zinc ribbon domain-containing protein [Ignavibacteriales bacterium]|nr:zinc ribbon domain-containing protein [Ignavibacteriales bacterium]